jgi:4-amino-4-deoxy-L-arabinose transferase-like glycosyltransferase
VLGAGGAAGFLRRSREHAWLGLWGLLSVAPLALRGPLPPDELRYLSVAWEMWSRGDFVLPYLNGAPYDDKGPLLFWLMHAGWAVLGINDWWPRLLPGLLALTAVFLARALCRTLWPAIHGAAALVPWLLLGSFAFAIYTQVVLFDLLLTNCTLLGLLGLAHAERAERGAVRGWLLVAAATALGLLSKGPVMLLHLAGAGLLAPWWRRAEGGFAARRWYSSLAAALGGGIALALAWVAAAVVRGGGTYGLDIVVNQTTGRLVDSFAHARPFWFYFAILPVLLFPWTAWPTAWRAVRDALRAGLPDHGSRLVVATIVPAFIAFSAMSGKQPHYLLPIVPLVACVLAAAIAPRRTAPASALLPAVIAAVAAIAMAALPLTAERLDVEPWSPAFGIAAAVASLALAQRGSSATVAQRLTALAPLIVLPAEAAFFLANRQAYDTTAAAAVIRTLEDAGHPVAYARSYGGEFHFSGRLTEPFEIIGAGEDDAAAWSQHHPDGYLVRYADQPRTGAIFQQRVRGNWLYIEQARP